MRIVVATLAFLEIAHIDSDLLYEDGAWGQEKLNRMSSAESFNKDTHSNIVRNYKKGLATSLIKCHNGIVDFLEVANLYYFFIPPFLDIYILEMLQSCIV